MATKDKNTKKSYGEEAGSKDAEREAAGQEGEEVAGPGRAAALFETHQTRTCGAASRRG